MVAPARLAEAGDQHHEEHDKEPRVVDRIDGGGAQRRAQHRQQQAPGIVAAMQHPVEGGERRIPGKRRDQRNLVLDEGEGAGHDRDRPERDDAVDDPVPVQDRGPEIAEQPLDRLFGTHTDRHVEETRHHDGDQEKRQEDLRDGHNDIHRPRGERLSEGQGDDMGGREVDGDRRKQQPVAPDRLSDGAPEGRPSSV